MRHLYHSEPKAAEVQQCVKWNYPECRRVKRSLFLSQRRAFSSEHGKLFTSSLKKNGLVIVDQASLLLFKGMNFVVQHLGSVVCSGMAYRSGQSFFCKS